MMDRNDQALAIRALRRAAPYIRMYKGRTFVVKAGGGVFASEESTRVLIEQIGILHYFGVRVVLVHGGGPQLTETADALGNFKRRAFVGDVELTGRIRRPVGLRRPFARPGRQLLDDAAFGMMDFFPARAGVTARLGAGARAHHRDAERQQPVAQLRRFAGRKHDADIGKHQAQGANELGEFAVAQVRERLELARARTQPRQ